MAQIQTPIEVNDDQLDNVMTILKAYLANPQTRDNVGLARFNKGWEVWLQVDLILFLLREQQLQHRMLGQLYWWQREVRVYENGDLPIDIWGVEQFAHINKHPSANSNIGIELKVERSTNQQSLQVRLREDIEKCLDGRRQLATQRQMNATPGTRLYCIGFTHQAQDVSQGWDDFFKKYPGEQIYWNKLPGGQITPGMESIAPYYLVWWMKSF